MHSDIRHRPIEILVVEEHNEATHRLVGSLLATPFIDAALPTHLTLMENYHAALAFLRQEGRYASAPRPDLIILDCTSTVYAGDEGCSAWRDEPARRCIPTVVLVPSHAEQDAIRRTTSPPSCCLLTPHTPEEFLRLAQTICVFWRTQTFSDRTDPLDTESEKGLKQR